jgi:hypothetical protein
MIWVLPLAQTPDTSPLADPSPELASTSRLAFLQLLKATADNSITANICFNFIVMPFIYG